MTRPANSYDMSSRPDSLMKVQAKMQVTLQQDPDTHLLPATNTRLTGPAPAAAYNASCSHGESASGEGGPKNVGATGLLLLLL
jgi:hypothetical protein